MPNINRVFWAPLLLACSSITTGQALVNTKPVALHQVYHVTPGEPVVLTFEGYDVDGDVLTTNILSLPTTGKLFELSQVFRIHQYEPKYDAESPLGGVVPTLVEHPGYPQQLIYVAPASSFSSSSGTLAHFLYQVRDSESQTSNVGRVLLIEKGTDVSIQSSFDSSAEDWKVATHGLEWSASASASSSVCSYSPTSMGGGLGMMNHFIYSHDRRIQVASASSNDDAQLWYFVAPPKFLGNHWELYHGRLSFRLLAGSGDFASGNLHLGETPLVILECSTCDLGAGIRLVFRLTTNAPKYQLSREKSGRVSQMTVPIDETQGWLKDSKSSIVAFTPPTPCELVEVLSHLSSVKILGDFTKGTESMSLDAVEYHVGPTGQPEGQPIACYT